MKLRCRVYNTILLKDKLGNKARNVNKPGALHTPSLRLDFFAPHFVSRQKSGREKKRTPCEPNQRHQGITCIKRQMYYRVRKALFIHRSGCRNAEQFEQQEHITFL